MIMVGHNVKKLLGQFTKQQQKKRKDGRAV